jgi:hypothetical protein
MKERAATSQISTQSALELLATVFVSSDRDRTPQVAAPESPSCTLGSINPAARALASSLTQQNVTPASLPLLAPSLPRPRYPTMSARTHHSFLSPSLSGAPPPAARKLRKEERDRGGNVLPQLLGSSSMSIRGDSYASGSNGVMRSSDRTATERSGHLAPRIQATIASAKERRTAKKDGISRRNMVVDEDGVAHDSECEWERTVDGERGRTDGLVD